MSIIPIEDFHYDEVISKLDRYKITILVLAIPIMKIIISFTYIIISL